MTRIQVKGFKIFADRHGKIRCYHRRTRHKIDLDAIEIGSAEFFAECQKIQALSDAIKAKEAKPGTLGGLIAYYYSTEHFKDTLSDRTRADYRRVANYLAPIANTPVTAINTPLIASIHDRAARKMGSPHYGDHLARERRKPAPDRRPAWAENREHGAPLFKRRATCRAKQRNHGSIPKRS